MLKRIKTLLGIEDSLQDDVLNIIIESVTSHLSGLLRKDVPDELEYIIMEISVRRFQRLGSEGMKSESVEGHNVTFYDLKDEFVPYLDIIESERDEPEEPQKRGKVMFI